MKIPEISLRRLLLAFGFVAMVATTAFSAQAKTFDVNSLVDASDDELNDGVCADEEGYCTLRAAFEQANHDAGDHVINLEAKTYQLSKLAGLSSDTSIKDHTLPLSVHCTDCLPGKRITLNGTGESSTRIRIADTLVGRHFYVGPGSEFEINDVTIENGEMHRGANVENYPGKGRGGALVVDAFGHADIRNTTFDNNHVTGSNSGGGGAIFNSGTLYLTDSTIQNCSSNTTELDPGRIRVKKGGAIYHVGSIAILSNVMITKNRSQHGGGIYLGYTAAPNPYSQLAPRLEVSNSEISHNEAEFGAGIYDQGGFLSLDEVTVVDNTNCPGEISTGKFFCKGPGAGLYSAVGSVSPRWLVDHLDAADSARGASHFAAECAGCHGGDSEFIQFPNMGSYTAEGLFNKILNTMPTTDPASCGFQCAADIVAFLEDHPEYSLGSQRDGQRRIKISGGSFFRNTYAPVFSAPNNVDNCALASLSPPLESREVASPDIAPCRRVDPRENGSSNQSKAVAGARRKAEVAYRYANLPSPSVSEVGVARLTPDYNKLVTSIVRPSIPYLFGPPINVDGTRDAAFSSQGIPQPIETLLSGTPSINSSDLEATWHALWDDDYLYFFVDVADNVARTDSTHPWNDDSVEIFIGGANTAASGYTESDFHYQFRRGDPVVHTGGGRSGVPTAGIAYQFEASAASYTVEVAIPWSTLGLAAGSQLGVELHVNDDDDGDHQRDTQHSWRTTFGDAWTNPTRFTKVDLPLRVLGRFFPEELISIDGLDTESEWIAQVGHPISRTVAPVALSDNTGTWKTAFDEENLYLFVSILDDAVTVPGAGAAYQDDSIEILIDANNSHLSAFDGYDDFQLLFRAGDPDDVWSFGPVSAVDSDMQIQSAFQITSAGYDLEVAIAWESLKTSPAEFERIGFDVQVNDDDDGGDRDGKVSWCAIDNDSYFNASLLCTLELDPHRANTNTILKTEWNVALGDPNIADLFTLDGSGDDPIWSNVPLVSEPLADPVVGSPSAAGFWRARWNNEYLYLYVFVADNEPMVSDSARWYNDDSVEIFIDANNNGGSQYDSFDYQFIFNPSVDDEVQVGFQNGGISTEGIRVKSVAGTGTYSMEIAIPWERLRIAPDELPIFGLEVQLNDDDVNDGSTDRLGKVGWNVTAAMGDVAWQRPDSFARVRLE